MATGTGTMATAEAPSATGVPLLGSMLESVLGLAVLLQSCSFEADDADVPLGAGITLPAKGPVRCRVTDARSTARRSD
ncbi:MAG: hypothetical protein QOF84_1804 [Streptomyces sp.]|jgi:hypothetical protein|nr:hypothetical protein [Streptomyces sp.]